MPHVRHFLSLDDVSRPELEALIARAIELKQQGPSAEQQIILAGKTLAMIFTKASTRTRVSFNVAMRQLGGGTIELTPNDTQIGRGEPLKDTARVLSSMVDGIMIRTADHGDIEQLAAFSQVPVINGLSDLLHPCQLLADLQTFIELRGSIQGATVAWVGDGNNVCHSFMKASALMGFSLRIATPKGFEPEKTLVKESSASYQLTHDPLEAVDQADLVVTDTWASMGQESEKAERLHAFEGFCVDSALMSKAKPDALFMHCLPAYRGYEVSEAVFEGPQSVVFQEAENRLHAQKALLELLLA